MKKKADLKKLTLAKETLRSLEDLTRLDLLDVHGGLSYTCIRISDCTCTHTVC